MMTVIRRRAQCQKRANREDQLDKPGTSAAALSAVDLTHSFTSSTDAGLALSGVSLDVVPGEVLCLLGPSGCGKSTLLNIFGGLLQPSHGTAYCGASPIRAPRPNDVAFVFQESVLFPWAKIIDNMDTALEFRGVPKAERRDRARKYLASVGMADFANHYPGQISGGMKQRVALASALSLETPILLLDEPFAALDEQTRMVLGEDLSQLLSRTGKTIVFVTHSLNEAIFLADRIVVMTARPGTIKSIVRVDEPHPRSTDFMTSDKFGHLHAEVYLLLRDEIKKVGL
jgi:NitT/TauT family transport system ATP-binding protein